MTLEEFESYCDDLIKQEIQDKPKIGKRQDVDIETTVWMNDSRIRLRKAFAEFSKYIEDADSNLIEQTIDKKIKRFVDRF